MALSTIATIATIAAAATSIGGTIYASQQKGPTQPDGASSSKKVAMAQAMALPDQLKLQQLMQQGGKGTVNMPAHEREEDFYWVKGGSGNEYDEKKGLLGRAAMGADPIGGTIMSVFGANKQRTVWNPVPKSEWGPGGQFEGQDPPPWGGGKRTIQVPEGPQEVDFSGFGTADIEGKKARDQADLELSLGQKYGKDFAELARQNQELADPLGTQARAKQFELMQKEMPVSPLSGTLDEQIRGQLEAGRGLDASSRELMDKAVADAAASRGGGASSEEVTGSMSTGAEGQRRLEEALHKSQGFMSSGQTPEDIAFKRNQQMEANLGAFISGQTPQSQFGNISRANQGATPVTGAQPNATMPNNAGAVGSNYSTAGFAANANTAANSTNSLFAGLSSLLTGIGSLKKKTG
jgi:hypothetical protein